MIYLTGYKGFIGKNYYRKHCRKNLYLIEKGDKFPKLNKGDTVIHLGATTDTTAELIECLLNNTLYTINLFEKCKRAGAKLIYASSASVYGNGDGPLNAYAFSKKLIDDYINGRAVGLRFFNVWGPGEEHKGKMMSFPSKIKQGHNTLFMGTEFYARDYIHVSDVVRVIDFFVNNYKPGIYDVGTGKATTYWELMKNVDVVYAHMPSKLKGKLQKYTRADLSDLEKVGFPVHTLKILSMRCVL